MIYKSSNDKVLDMMALDYILMLDIFWEIGRGTAPPESGGWV